MTRQAIADVAVDWQVQLAPGSDPQAATAELGRSPGFTSLAQVGYADTPGLETSTGSTVQTTGPGKVLGLIRPTATAFPAEIRDLIGQGSVLLAQQTAANLHAAPGSVVTVQRPGLDPVPVTVSGVVDLPLADALFQAIGAPPGAAPVAPPDNVLLLPLDQWHALFDPVASVAPDAVRLQLHAALRTTCRPIRTRPTPTVDRRERAITKRASREPGSSATIWRRGSTWPAPTRSTRRCSSSSWGCLACSWPRF